MNFFIDKTLLRIINFEIVNDSCQPLTRDNFLQLLNMLLCV